MGEIKPLVPMKCIKIFLQNIFLKSFQSKQNVSMFIGWEIHDWGTFNKKYLMKCTYIRLRYEDYCIF
jgi:hypothetical protein